MGEQLLGDDGLGVLPHHDFRLPLGGVHAADLGALQIDGGPLLQIHDGLGVHDALAGAGALAVVALHIADLGVFAHVEGVHAVVLAGLAAGVVDAAAGHDVHIAVLADEEVVVYHLAQPGLADDDRDVDRLVPGARLDADVDARLARLGLGGDLNVGGAVPGVQRAVAADVVGPLGGLLQLRDLFQQFPLSLIHAYLAPSDI